MKTIGKWASRLLLVAVFVTISLGALIYWRFQSSLPQVEGEIELAGLQAKTTIVRDKYGIPHIFAPSRHDMYFAIGVAHAQDRLFQMDMSRRAAHGRLSELVGKLTLTTDVQMRTLGLGKAADQSFTQLSPETQGAFRAYAEGVNSVLTQPGFVAPPEYTLLMAKPELWRPEDCAAVLKMMAYGLSGNAYEEPGHAKLIEILGPERAAEFLAPYPADAPVTLSEADLGIAQIQPGSGSDVPAFSTPGGEPKKGSNNWVVDGHLTSSGKPLLANDPHLALSAPGVWYFARMQTGDDMMLGATIPGTPFVTLGRTRDAAWGFTNTGPDTADLFLVDQSDLQATIEEAVIKVRWGKDQLIQIQQTERGPVLDPQWFNAGKMAQDGQVVVIQNTLDDDDDTTGDLGIALLGAHVFSDFQAGLEKYKMPQQNMVFADSTDTIGFIAPARVPVRDENGEWIGEIPYDELPMSTNTQRHYYASANNKIVPDSYPHFITSSWYGYHRIRRIVEMIENTELHDKRSFARMQMDTVSDLARRAIPLIASSEPDTDGGRELQQLLASWDGNLTANGPEGLVYSKWMRNFTKGLFADDLGKDFDQFWSPRREFVDGVLAGRYKNWCDDITTGAMESCHQIAATALDDTFSWLMETYQQPIADLHWGDVHAANFAHPLLDKTPLGRFFSVRTPVGGDESTVNVAHTSYSSGNFEVMWGPSMRAIYDFSDLNASMFMHGPGQSGHVLSPHYRDLARSWAAGDFFEIRADWTEVSPPPGSTILVLSPLSSDGG
ncbi:MAG: acyl-homoserine-lactone acylase [Robiginitomaculum sp.]|nr:MAG: acyl-homoserine-lactone acylase [Robiginitomaculum sp.]